MTECLLRNVLIVEHGVALDGGGQLLAADEAGGGENVADASVESLDHAMGLWMPRRNQAMLDPQQHALAIEGVLSGGCLALAGETVGELAAVPRRGSSIVGQNLHDLHGRCGAQVAQEVGAADFALIGVESQIHSASGAVDRHE